MAEIAHNHINKAYIADNKGGLNDITRVICIVLPNSFTICGFDDKSHLILIDQFESEQQWSLDFYKSKLVNRSWESLLRKTIAIFIDTQKELLVPKALYSESESEKWFKKVHFVEVDERIESVQLKDKAWYMFTLPADVRSLLEDHIQKVKLLPIAAYQFHKQAKANNIVECCVSPGRAYITLYKDKMLHWHRVINYERAEEIACEVKLVCRDQNVMEDELIFECVAIAPELSSVVAELSEYFPRFEDGIDRNIVKDNSWAGTAYLLQQLNSCAL